MTLPVAQSSRIARMYSERHYLLNFKSENEKSTLSVSGSTGNIYEIVIEPNKISCDCLDFTGHAQYDQVYCKHCCFVIYRVLSSYIAPENVQPRQIDADQCIQWQRTLAQKELLQLKHLVAPDVRKNLDKIASKDKNLKDFGVVEPKECKKQEKLDDCCGVCYEELKDAKYLVECGECFNLIHQECADCWLRNGTVETCVYCRVSLPYAFYLQHKENSAKKRKKDYQ